MCGVRVGVAGWVWVGGALKDRRLNCAIIILFILPPHAGGTLCCLLTSQRARPTLLQGLWHMCGGNKGKPSPKTRRPNSRVTSLRQIATDQAYAGTRSRDAWCMHSL